MDYDVERWLIAGILKNNLDIMGKERFNNYCKHRVKMKKVFFGVV